MKAKKKVRSLTEFTHGDEPLVQNADKIQTIKILNWYSSIAQDEERTKWLMDYVTQLGTVKMYGAAIRTAGEYLPATAAHVIRALTHGTTFADTEGAQKAIQSGLDALLAHHARQHRSEVTHRVAAKPNHYWMVEDQVDRILHGQPITMKDIPKLDPDEKKLVMTELDEFRAVKSDSDLKEAYHFTTPKTIQAVVAFLEQVVHDSGSKRKRRHTEP